MNDIDNSTPTAESLSRPCPQQAEGAIILLYGLEEPAAAADLRPALTTSVSITPSWPPEPSPARVGPDASWGLRLGLCACPGGQEGTDIPDRHTVTANAGATTGLIARRPAVTSGDTTAYRERNSAPWRRPGVSGGSSLTELRLGIRLPEAADQNDGQSTWTPMLRVADDSWPDGQRTRTS